MTRSRPPTRRAHFDDPERWAQHITEKVMTVWWAAHAGTDLAVPIGTVAALALVREQPQLHPSHGDTGGLEVGAEIAGMTADQFGAWLRIAWGLYWFERPDLIERARPFHAWLHRDGPDTRRHLNAALRVAWAAINAGILELTADPDLRHDVDLLGPLIEQMRGRADKRARGDFHTPPSVSQAIAAVLLGDARPGQETHTGARFLDPAAGSGGMLRAAAQDLRARGLDPADYVWCANDIDPIAASACAVNFMLWDLGAASVVACSDALTDPDGIERAHAEAIDWLRRRDAELTSLRLLFAARGLPHLPTRVDDSTDAPTTQADDPDGV